MRKDEKEKEQERREQPEAKRRKIEAPSIDLGPSALDPFVLVEYRLKVPPLSAIFIFWSLLH